MSTSVVTKWNSKNKKRYVDLGYHYTKMRDDVLISINDLAPSSMVNVDVQCDYCGKRFQKPWYRYQKEHSEVGGDACGDCKQKKWSSLYLSSENAVSPLLSEKANEKRKATWKKKYGVEHIFSSALIKEKIKQHWIDTFGVVSYRQTQECQQKIEETCLERYGRPNYFTGIHFTGPNSPCWKGGVQYHRQERSTIEYITWRSGVYNRDHYTCQVCNNVGGKLVAHHLYNWKDYPEQRYDIDNGVTLCEQCHFSFHSLYGKKNNTPEQFVEYCMSRQKDMLNYQEDELVELQDKKLVG